MKKNLRGIVGLIGLSVSHLSYAQTSYKQLELVADAIEQKSIEVSKNVSVQKALSFTDTDNDGMPDAWENANALNANDAKDAFADPDNDNVLNLFEYQLNANPKNASTPVKVNIAFGQNINAAITNAANNTVLRIESGNYNVNYKGTASKKIMIQGAWNSSFTGRNVLNAPTNFSGQSLNGILEFAQTPSKNDTCSIVLDGINLVNAKAYTGALTVYASKGRMQLSLIDCIVKNNEITSTYAGALSLFNWSTTEADITIVRSLIAGNTNATGIYSQNTDGSNCNWRFINLTISNNNSVNPFQGYGFRAATMDSTICTVKVKNSILWDNQLEGFRASGNTTLNASYSNINSYVVSGTLATYNTGAGMINANPLFANSTALDYSLQSMSPCVNSGTDVGLLFYETAPEMGHYESLKTIGIAGLNHANANNEIKFYPNPGNGLFRIAGVLDQVKKIEIYNSLGEKVIGEVNFTKKNETEVDLTSFTKGIYLVKIYEAEKVITKKVIIE